MDDDSLAWAKKQRAVMGVGLKGLRSGVLGTSEMRNGKRIDTTAESIAEKRRGLAELETVIAHDEAAAR